jgi:WD40 repeat protein
MPYIFISYSRKDLSFAKKIIDALAQYDIEVWVDETNIPKGEKLIDEIKHGIENTDTFLFLISPDSVQSAWCKKETSIAIEKGKRILPILITETDKTFIPTEISAFNWISFLNEQDDFDKTLYKISEAIHKDNEWAKYHTQLQNKADEWMRSHNDKAHLLRGNELQNAEHRLSFGREKDPPVTKSQSDFTIASRDYEIRTRKTITYISAFVAVVLLITTIAALVQRNNAIRQADVSQSLALSASAQNALMRHDQDLALALAMEAVKIENPPNQASTILGKIAFSPGTKKIIQTNNNEGIFRVAYSPDGRLILSVSGHGDIHLWDALTGREIRRIGDHGTYGDGIDPLISGVTFSPDNRIGITAGGEDVRFWDLETGNLIRKIQLGNGTGFNVAAFDKDARFLFWGSIDGSVHFLDLSSGNEIWESVDAHQADVYSVALNIDGTMALSGGQDGKVILWDTATGMKTRGFTLQSPSILRGESLATFSAVAFNPNNKMISGSTFGGETEIWNIDTGKIISKIDASEMTRSVKFSKDGKYLFLGYSQTLGAWDIKNGQQKYSFTGHMGWINDISFSPNGDNVLSGSMDGTMRIWNLSSETNTDFIGHTSNVNKLSLSDEGNSLLSSSWDGSLRVWDTRSGAEIQRIKSDEGLRYSSAEISPDGQLVLAGDRDGITLYNASDGEIIYRISGHKIESPTAIGFLPERKLFYTFDFNGSMIGFSAPDSIIRLWDIDSGELKAELFNRGVSETIFAAVPSQDGRYIISANTYSSWLGTALDIGSVINIWDLDTKEKSSEISIAANEGFVISLAISTDSEFIYAGLITGDILVFQRSNGELVNRISGHSMMITSLVVSPDGRYLASSSADESIRVFETETWGDIAEFTVDDEIRSLVFDSNASRLFAGTKSGIVHAWLISPDIDNTLRWIKNNRYVKVFSCLEREEYNIQDRCDEEGNYLGKEETVDLITPEVSEYIPATKEVLGESVANQQLEHFEIQQVSDEYTGTPHYWQFDLEAGDAITILLESNKFDPYLILKDNAGKVIASNDDFEEGISNNASIRELKVKNEGTYYLVVDRYLNYSAAGKGSYALTLTIQNEIRHSSLTLKQISAGKFGIGFSQDETGDLLIDGVVEGSPAFNAGLRPSNIITKINGLEIKKLSFRQIWDLLRVPVGSENFFSVKDESSMSNYYIKSVSQADGAYLTSNMLELGKKYFSEQERGEIAYWEFSGQKDQNISIIRGGGTSSVSGDMQIFSMDKTFHRTIQEFDNEIGMLLTRLNAWKPMLKLPDDGDYIVEVVANGTDAGKGFYTLSVQTLVAQGKLESKDYVEGSLSATDGYFWTFMGRKGQFLIFDFEIKDSLLEPIFVLIAPDNTIVVADTKDGFDVFTNEYNYDKLPDSVVSPGYPLSQDGEYKFLIIPYLRAIPVKQTGNYTFSFEVVDISVDKIISANEKYSANLDANELKVFGYEGKKGEKIRVTVSTKKPASDAESYFDAVERDLLDVFLVVLDNNGNLIDFSGDYEGTTDAQVEVVLPEDGLYIFEVSTEDDFGRGKMSILVENIEE